MNWQVKALVQSALSLLPLGDQLNFVLSRYVSKSVPASGAVFTRDVSFAIEHVESFRKHGTYRIEEARFYEFGVGWDLTIPLTFYSLGINRQTVVDLRPLIKVALVRQSASRLSSCRQQCRLVRSPDILADLSSYAQLVKILHTECSIDYRAPFDAGRTGLESASFDYISATSVLQHIPFENLVDILRECFRILRPEGMIRVLNDYRDNYSYVDPNISVYNFLQFSDKEWKRFNPTLHYQNRLRHVDHVRLFIEAGFEIVESEPGYDQNASRELISKVSLAEKFRYYPLDDLVPVRGVILARKPAGTASLG
jgi:SAM-dependent methyltransferase